MPAWVQNVLASPTPSAAVLLAALVFGILGSISHGCNLAFVGAVVGYSGSLSERRDRRGLALAGVFFIVGTVLALTALGAVIGLVGNVARACLGAYWKFGAGLIMVFFGLICLGLAPFRLPKLGPPGAPARGGAWGPMAYGLVVGGAAAMCAVLCNPLLLAALGYTTSGGRTVWSAALLGTFALGYSLPLAVALVGLGWGFGKLRATTEKIGAVVRYAAGVLLVGAGFYMLATL